MEEDRELIYGKNIHKKGQCKKSLGSIMDLLSVGISVLALSVIMLAIMECVGVLQTRAETGQIVRKYLLHMETIGYLTAQDQENMKKELQDLGLTNISLDKSTCSPVNYGEEIVLWVKATAKVNVGIDQSTLWERGLTKREFTIEEKLVSTAKQ